MFLYSLGEITGVTLGAALLINQSDGRPAYTVLVVSSCGNGFKILFWNHFTHTEKIQL